MEKSAFWDGFEKRANIEKKRVMAHVKAFNNDPEAKHLGKAECIRRDGKYIMSISRNESSSAGPQDKASAKPNYGSMLGHGMMWGLAGGLNHG